jgi:hypothetical protein
MFSTSHETAMSLVADLRNVFGDRLRSVVAYGPQLDGHASAPLTCMALVTSLTAEDLEGCARLSARWGRARTATPLILPEDEFRGSLDAFPLEYGEIIRSHVDVYGDDPFAHVAIVTEDLRRACETQVKSHLVHLRESFIETGGVPGAVSELVRTAAPALAALLRNVARLADVSSHDREDATRAGARFAGIPEHVVNQVLALERPSAAATGDPARFFAEYLAAVEQLARSVDTWHAAR